VTSQPFTTTPQGVCVSIRLTPKAGRTSLDDVAVDAAGTPHLKARVTAVPEKGKANKALLKLLAKAWGLSQSRLQIVAGEKDRNKTVLLQGDTNEISRILKEWFDGRNS
jgi:uncharacterized protein (TIGR00251 family)